MLVGAAKVVFSVVTWTAFGLAEASQATEFDDEVSVDCATLAATANDEIPATPSVPSKLIFLIPA